MAQLQKLPESHTDLIVSLRWESITWPWTLVAIGAIAGIVAVLLYRRRRRNDR
jgi:LPXTG-motif cell wall-anchored protein